MYMYMYIYIYISITQNLEVKWNKCSFERVSARGMINWKGFSLQGGNKLNGVLEPREYRNSFVKYNNDRSRRF